MRANTLYIFVYLLPYVLVRGINAQEIKIEGRFANDTVLVGEPVSYRLILTYPETVDLLLPDSVAEYPGLEYVKKEFTPTVTKNNISSDTVTYWLRSFSPDTTVVFAMPVYWLQPNDSLQLFAKPDSLIIGTVLPAGAAADTLELTASAQLVPIRNRFNYPYLIIGIAAGLIIIIIVLIVFGDRLKNWWRVWQLNKKHKSFINKYNRTLDQIQVGKAPVDNAYLQWKQYLEQLENKPYTKLTSSEIAALNHDYQELIRTLQALDKSIYGYGSSTDNLQQLALLKETADKKYSAKKNRLLNA